MSIILSETLLPYNFLSDASLAMHEIKKNGRDVGLMAYSTRVTTTTHAIIIDIRTLF